MIPTHSTLCRRSAVRSVKLLRRKGRSDLICSLRTTDCLIFLPPPTPLFFFSLLGLLPNHRVAALYFNYSPLGQPHGTDGPLPSWLPLTSASRPT
ncbi:hypothetical protein AFLA_002480 [Aspergillus flavus NRRL3357]|nr:hypothetical protein AFLA_002480 [Aspergillus flavus NRRL3357]